MLFPMLVAFNLLPIAQASGPAAAAPACAATAPLPRDLAGWSTMRPMRAAERTARLGTAEIDLGHGYRTALHGQRELALPIAPTKAAGEGTSGGLLAFTVTRAGRYRVALGAGAWVEVVRNGRALVSAAHGHGPECTGIRKMVDYDLAPGRYILQLSGSPQPSLSVMVAPSAA